jgi:hypothetical protein
MELSIKKMKIGREQVQSRCIGKISLQKGLSLTRRAVMIFSMYPKINDYGLGNKADTTLLNLEQRQGPEMALPFFVHAFQF